MKSVNDIMPMIGARFYTQLDAAQVKCDVLEGELAKVRRGGTRGAFTLLRHLFKRRLSNQNLREGPENQHKATSEIELAS